ncbi:MAG TPA: YbhB/YbcL family Raf kinase inhibitor-like protein [Candidatus Saccharimonadales bacterium]|nr:YbhB/YbcL family Raf kinase inhibitor-like protein [Candidatus Saccharimonadales bacterium]
MDITSPAFANNDTIPVRFGHAQDNVNPPLVFTAIPPDTQSLVMIMDDPDAINGTFTHWVMYNIPPAETHLGENEVPVGAREGVNDYGKKGYGGPQPPSGTHRYFFKLYALDDQLDLEEGATAEEVEEAIEGHVITKAQLIGLYSA